MCTDTVREDRATDNTDSKHTERPMATEHALRRENTFIANIIKLENRQ